MTLARFTGLTGLLVFYALLLTACATGAAVSSATGPEVVSPRPSDYTVVNVMPRFWRFLDAARDADAAEKRRLFREVVIAGDAAVFQAFSGGPSDALLDKWLLDVAPWLDAMHDVDARLDKELRTYRRTFAAMFPAARWDDTYVYFMPWFFISDAGTGSLADGRRILIFGVDDIARYRGSRSNLATLFHHELFHLYHAAVHPEWAGSGRGPLYRAVWVEGLATYVSRLLNPQAALGEVLGDAALPSRMPGGLGTVAHGIHTEMDSTSASINRDYLSASPTTKELPARSGYYVGMLVAERLSVRHSLTQLVTLRDPELRSEVSDALQDIETQANR